MKNNKILIVLIIGTFIVSSIGGFLGAGEKSNITDYTTKSYTDSIVLSKANIVDKENFEIVELNGAESNIYSTGKPIIPVVTKTFTAPAGSRLIDSQISIEWETIILDKQIQPAEQALPMTTDEVTFGYQKSTFDSSIYSSTALYPTEPYTVTTGSGIQGTDHVLFINVRVNAQYSPANNYINVPKNIEIKLNVEEPLIPLFSTNVYDLLIITDVKFKEQMDRLAAHKNSIGIKTKVTTTDEIYPNYDGVADWEDIKLYLADVVKEWGVDYVLLAGGHKGQTNEWYIPEFLSHNFDEAYSGGGVAYDLTYAADLYYADVYYYNQYGQPVMDNWDSNKNGIYAEGPFYKDSYDVPDYYPDVHIGRIPLRYSWEANIIVDKIIEYESNAADPSWFKKGILCGGDTTPPARYEGATQGVYEGEMSGDLGAEYLSSIDFSTTKCYTSNNGDIVLTDPDLFTSIISEGCGWVQMDTHSNPATCGNFQPDAPTEAEFNQFYTIFDVRNLNNDGEYPFLIIDGCHSGQYNVTMQSVIDAGGINFPRAYFLEWAPTDQCSWALLQEGGGSIGTIGVTALGYGYVNDGATQGLGGWLTPRWAQVYAIQGKEYLGQIFTQGINDYIDIIGFQSDPIVDRKTIEERDFLGDPSLKLGGIGTSLSDHNNEDNKETQVSFSNIDVPVWQVGDKWTYEINNIDYSYHEVEGRDIDLKFNTADITLTVLEVLSDTYKVEFSTTNANIDANIYFDTYVEGKEPINASIKLKNVNLLGNFIFTKDSLAIESVDVNINFDVIENLEGLPIDLNLPPIIEKFLPKIKIPADIQVKINFDPELTWLDFPLETGKTWGFPATTITIKIDGEINSVWLRLASIINKIVPIIPEDFAKYLPVIDISDVLQDYGIPTLINIDVPQVNELFRKPLFEAYTEKTITVPKGTYNSYQILIFRGIGEVYYSPEAKTFIKLSTPINEFCPVLSNVQMVLKK